MSRVSELLLSLSACLCAQFEVDENIKPCFCGIVPGEVAMGEYVDCDDDAEDCGMAWVRLTGAFPTSNGLEPSITPGNCAKEMGVNLEMGILRCITVMDEQGNGPSAAVLERAALQQIADLGTMKRALMCCDALPDKDWFLGTYTPSGPLGGYVGGTWTLALIA